MIRGYVKFGLPIILGAFIGAAFASTAFAGTATVTEVSENMVASARQLPGMVSGLAYLIGLVLGISGIFKLKAHVDNPANTPIKSSIIRLVIGGSMFALPIVYAAMATTINGGANANFTGSSGFSITGFLSGALGSFASLLGRLTGGIATVPDLNGTMAMIIRSISGLPGLISAGGYLLGLVLGVGGLLKIKDHVENPEQTAMKEGVIRLLAGGAFFALPTVYSGMQSLITGGNTDASILSLVTDGLAALSFSYSSYAGLSLSGLCNPVAGVFGNSVGDSMCGVLLHAGAFPAFLTALSYLFGLVLGFWGILKVRDHVLNPQQTTVWEGVSKFVAGGAFFSLPFLISVLKSLVAPTTSSALASFATVTGYTGNVTCAGGGIGGAIGAVLGAIGLGGGGGGAAASGGLDGALGCMMNDILGPTHVVLNFFTFVVGIIFLMIGISRLTKSAQDGARGPGGLGTMMTFLAGGALMSYNELIRAFTSTLSMGMAGGLLPVTQTRAALSYTTGMTAGEVAHAHVVITAIIKFMILVGLISFVRGIFIIRSVAEGNGQASMMSGMTHLVGGALAVNLGPLLNAVQTTLGITGYGITFS